jgi:DNA-binding phage protein
MPNTKTRLWGAAEHLETTEGMEACLEAALGEGDPALIAEVLGTSRGRRE